MAPDGARIRVGQVTYSLDELTALQSPHFVAIAFVGDPSGVSIVSIGVDIRHNRVSVDVANLTNEIADRIAAKYGGRVLAEDGEAAAPATCNSRTDCGSPLKGGLYIYAGALTCTSAFLGRTQGSSKLFLMTAGHCIQDSGLSATWYHHGAAIGTGYVYDYMNNANADAGSIVASESGARNRAYATSATDIRSMTSALSNASQPVGGLICRSGATSGYDCGYVTSTNRDVYLGPYLVHHMWETGYSSAGGDSGAPMMVDYSWAGIFSCYNTQNSYYTTTDWVASTILATPCMTASC